MSSLFAIDRHFRSRKKSTTNLITKSLSFLIRSAKTMAAIKTDSISFGFQKNNFQALNNVSINVPNGIFLLSSHLISPHCIISHIIFNLIISR